MRVFPVRIKLANVAEVQRSHDADAREHRRPARAPPARRFPVRRAFEVHEGRDCAPFSAQVARFGRRPTLPSETLRIPNRPRTAVTVRLSPSDMIVMVFPASTISRSWLSSSGSQGRLPYLGMIILTGGANAARTGRATWPIPPFAAGQLTRHQAI